MSLTPKQARFVEEYLLDLSATDAACRAGYSRKTAESQGSRLLSNVKVREAIDAALAARSERVEVKADDVLRELLRLARVDLGEAFDKDGRLKAVHSIPPDVRRAIAGIEVEELFEGHGPDRVQTGHVRKVKFWEKTKALELLGKHLKLFTDKLEVSGRLTLEQLVEASTKPPELK